MPELPEVETTVRGLRPLLEGQRIAAVEVRRADLRRSFPDGLAQRLTGATITIISRRAKYGIIATDRDASLIFHLGMSGRWRTGIADDAPLDKHDHLVLTMDSGARVALNDPRRFGSVDLVEGETEAAFTPFAALGPEPLSDAFDGAYLHQALRGRVAAIKLLLLDQRIVAGLGNIYVCEALHLAHISPKRAGGHISRWRLDALASAIKTVLVRAIEVGGSTIRDYRQPDGELGYFAHEWRVYGREGAACPTCAAPVARFVQGGRSTFWCARCQR